VLAYGLFPVSVAIFAPDGKLARTQSLQRDDAGATPGFINGHTPDGSVVTVLQRVGRRAAEPTSYRDSMTIFWFSVEGKQRATTGRIEDVLGARVPTSRNDCTQGPAGRGFSCTLASVAPGTVTRFDGITGRTVASNGGPVYHFEEANDALAIYGPDGTQARRVLIRPLAPDVRPADGTYNPISQTQVLELRADRLGRAWVEVARETRDAPRKWWVFDPQGKWIAEARTPPRAVSMLELGPDYILVLKTDADGLQAIAYCPMK
jgi:hypothetical protein